VLTKYSNNSINSDFTKIKHRIENCTQVTLKTLPKIFFFSKVLASAKLQNPGKKYLLLSDNKKMFF